MESERRSKGNKEADDPSLLLLYLSPPTQTEQPASLLWWGLGSQGTERTLFPTKESSRWMLWRPALSRSLADVSGDVERMSSTTSRSIGDSGHFRRSGRWAELFLWISLLGQLISVGQHSCKEVVSKLREESTCLFPPFFFKLDDSKAKGGKNHDATRAKGFWS